MSIFNRTSCSFRKYYEDKLYQNASSTPQWFVFEMLKSARKFVGSKEATQAQINSTAFSPLY